MTRNILAALTLIVVFIGIGIYFLTNDTTPASITPTPQPTREVAEPTEEGENILEATPTESIEMTDDETEASAQADGRYSGTVASISEELVGYKNSLLLELTTKNGTIQVYVTPETLVREVGDNSRKERSVIESGYSVSVTGVAAEGGIEAKEIIIHSEN